MSRPRKPPSESIRTRSLAFVLPVLAGLFGLLIFTQGSEVQFELAVLVLGSVVTMILLQSGEQRVLMATVFCLAFTQAPTVKLLLRWRLSELLAWSFILNVRSRRRPLPPPARAYVWITALYVAYAGALGLFSVPVIRPNDWVLEYVLHPLLRPLLESARLVAALSLLAACTRLLSSWQDFRSIVKCLAVGGALASVYGLYQAANFKLGLNLPLLPGTVESPTGRPFSTFYEPTGFGCYTAVAALLSLYLVGSRPSAAAYWLLCLLNLFGLTMSVSAAGALAFGSALLVLALLSPIRATLTLPLVGGVIAAGLSATVFVLGDQFTSVALSTWFFEQRLAERIEDTRRAIDIVAANPMGLGIGNTLLSVGGVHGLARVVIESGVVGTALLIAAYVVSWWSTLRLRTSSDREARRFAPFAGASSICILVVSFNYNNTTDLWLWFTFSLPVLALVVQAREQRRMLARARQPTESEPMAVPAPVRWPEVATAAR